VLNQFTEMQRRQDGKTDSAVFKHDENKPRMTPIHAAK